MTPDDCGVSLKHERATRQLPVDVLETIIVHGRGGKSKQDRSYHSFCFA